VGVVVGYFLRNFHILVFAFVFISGAVWVALNPDQTVTMIKPVVEDAEELAQMAETVYVAVASINFEASVNEAIVVYTAALRMPSMVLERVDHNLKHASERITGLGSRSVAPPSADKLTLREVSAKLKDL
jgi:hypothetical protein